MTNKVVEVINFNNHIFQLNEEELKQILLSDEVKDRYVCVVSIAGSFRKGKSFMLNLFLRYLYAQYVHFNVSNWLGDENEPLTGFSWSSGPKRNTLGMLMWSDVFLYDNPNGEKIAILLLDTQGIFDHQSTTRDCVTIFALATMLSSVTIYNVSQNIQEDDLRNLQLFVEYGRMALMTTNQKPFQRLQFLVRDWQYPDDIKYGEEGGAQVLSKYLKITRGQSAELRSVRQNIKSCFNEITCFLMPHPECMASSSSKFDGRLKYIDSEFKDNLKIFVPLLFSPDKLICKEINGERIKASMLVNCFQSYVAIWKDDKLPEPNSLMNTTMELFIAKIIQDFVKEYEKVMVDIFMNDYLTITKLNENHARVKDDLLNKFNEKVISVNEKYKHVRVLENQIESLYDGIFKKLYEKSEKDQNKLWEELRKEMQSQKQALKERESQLVNLIEPLKNTQNEIFNESKYWNEQLKILEIQAFEKNKMMEKEIMDTDMKIAALNQPTVSRQQNDDEKEIANMTNRFAKQKQAIDDQIAAISQRRKCLEKLNVELQQKSIEIQEKTPQSQYRFSSLRNSETSRRKLHQVEYAKFELAENNKKIQELTKDVYKLDMEKAALKKQHDEKIMEYNSQIAKFQKKDNNIIYNQLQEKRNNLNQTLYKPNKEIDRIKLNLCELERQKEDKAREMQQLTRMLNNQRTLMFQFNETALKNKIKLL